jgi:outer membrane protein
MKNLFILLALIISSNSSSKIFNLEDLYKHGLEHNPDGKILSSQAEEIAFGLKKVKSEFFPEVYAVVGGEARRAGSDETLKTNRFIAEMRLKYNLFKFGQTQNGLKAFEGLHQIKEQKYQLWKQDVIREVKSLFYEATTINEKLKFLKKELLYNEKMKQKVIKRKKRGLIGKSDILDIDLRKLNIETQILELVEKLDHKLDDIRKVSFIDHEDEVNLDTEIPHSHYNLNLKNILEKSRLNNRSISLSALEEKSQQYAKSKIDKNRFPEVNLMGRFGRMRIDEQYSNNSTEGLVGIYVEIPFFDGGKKKSTQRIYEEKYRQRKLKAQVIRNDVSIEVTHKYELLNNIHKQLDLGEMGHQRGIKYFSSVLDEYNRGIKNSLDLVSARDRLVNLKLKLIESKKEYIITVLKLEKLIGEKL